MAGEENGHKKISVEDMLGKRSSESGNKKLRKKLLVVAAVLTAALAVIMGVLYAEKSASEDGMADIPTTSNLAMDSVKWGIADVSTDAGDESEDVDNGITTVSAMDQIRESVYEQIKDAIEDGTITLDGSSGELTDEQLKEIMEQVTASVTNSLSESSSGTLSDAEKNALISEIVKEATAQISSTTLSDTKIQEMVYATVSSLSTYLKGEDGTDGADGEDGEDGRDGEDGEDGEDGYTPVKGVDYFTSSEIDSMVNLVAQEIISNGDITLTAQSAYETAVKYGYTGTEEDWYDALISIISSGSATDTETIRETILSIIGNTYQPTVTKDASGKYVLTIPVSN